MPRVQFQGSRLLPIIRLFGPVLRKDIYLYWSRLELEVARLQPNELLGYLRNEVRLERFIELTKFVESDFYRPKYQAFLSTVFKTIGPNFITEVSRALDRRPTTFSTISGRIVQYISEVGLDKAVKLLDRRQAALRFLIDQIADLELSYDQGRALMQSAQVLTPKMARALGRFYRNALEKGIPVERALELAKEKSEAAKRWRSGLQIRTELNRAKHEADIEALRQLRDKRIIRPNERIYKLWQRTNFQDNHQNSIDNDGVTVPLDETWADGSLYPNKINELCFVSYIVETREQAEPPALDIFQPTPETFPLPFEQGGVLSWRMGVGHA